MGFDGVTHKAIADVNIVAKRNHRKNKTRRNEEEREETKRKEKKKVEITSQFVKRK